MRTIGLTFEENQKTIEPPFDYSGTEDVVDLKSMTVAELNGKVTILKLHFTLINTNTPNHHFTF